MALHLERLRIFFPGCLVALLAVLPVDSMAISHVKFQSAILTPQKPSFRGRSWQFQRRTGLSDATEASILPSHGELGSPSTFRRPRTLVTQLQAKVTRTIPPLPTSNFVPFHSGRDQGSSIESPVSVISKLPSTVVLNKFANDPSLIQSDKFIVDAGTDGNELRSHSGLLQSRGLRTHFAIPFTKPKLTLTSADLIDFDSTSAIPSTASATGQSSSSGRSGLENGHRVNFEGIRENFLSMFGTRPVLGAHARQVDPKLFSFSDVRHFPSNVFNVPQNSQRETTAFSFKRGRNSRRTRTSFVAPEETNDISPFSSEFHSTTNTPSRLRSSLQATIIGQQSTSSPFENYAIQDFETKPGVFQKQIVIRRPAIKLADGNDISSNSFIRLVSADHSVPSRTLSNPRQHLTGVSYSLSVPNTKIYPLLRGNFVGSRTFVG